MFSWICLMRIVCLSNILFILYSDENKEFKSSISSKYCAHCNLLFGFGYFIFKFYFHNINSISLLFDLFDCLRITNLHLIVIVCWLSGLGLSCYFWLSLNPPNIIFYKFYQSAVKPHLFDGANIISPNIV